MTESATELAARRYQGKTAWEFACDWYQPESIAYTMRSKSSGPIPSPKDVDAFAAWLANEYRLAMNKGFEIAERAAEDNRDHWKAESERLNAVLASRYGGEPRALLDELDAAREECERHAAEVRRLKEILTGEAPARAIQALHRTNLIREARASCSLDGDTQSEGDRPPYVLISEDRLKRYESELAELREKVRRLEGAEAENASLD
jgi:hypothetical protein